MAALATATACTAVHAAGSSRMSSRPASSSCRPFQPFSRSLVAQPLVAATPRAAAPRRAALAVSATAAPQQQKIRIKLKSYWVDLLHDAVDKIKEAAASTGATISGPVPLPTRKRIYTVLRSPHVNKDSREQFEVRVHQRLVDIKNLSSQTIDKLMQLDLAAGVDVEVKL